MASKEILRRALPHWPHDVLRPTAQLGTVLATRLSKPPPTQSPATPPRKDDANAILSLLTNKFSRKYALPAALDSKCGGIMTPRSNPGYYAALMKDLEEVPTRTWLQKVGIRLKGFVRFS